VDRYAHGHGTDIARIALLFEVRNALDLLCPTTLLREFMRNSRPLVLMADSGEHRFGGAGTKPRCRFSGYCSAEPLGDSLLDNNKTLLVV
jgi:hypothetical protein